jgi:hypothetical protein
LGAAERGNNSSTANAHPDTSAKSPGRPPSTEIKQGRSLKKEALPSGLFPVFFLEKLRAFGFALLLHLADQSDKQSFIRYGLQSPGRI